MIRSFPNIKKAASYRFINNYKVNTISLESLAFDSAAATTAHPTEAKAGKSALMGGQRKKPDSRVV